VSLERPGREEECPVLSQVRRLFFPSFTENPLILIEFCGYFFVASSHRICGEEGSPILWLLIVPTYDLTAPMAKTGSCPDVDEGVYLSLRLSVRTSQPRVWVVPICTQPTYTRI
jgi:hypothetical protein